VVAFGALLGLLWSRPASSADVDAAELYGHLPTISMMEISPDGSTIAFRRMADDGDRIMLYSLAKNQLVGSISLNEDIDPNDIMFADADTLVLVVSQYGRIEGFRGRDDYSRAFVYSTRDHEFKMLLEPGGVVYVGQPGLGEIVGVSPAGKYAYMPAFSGQHFSVSEGQSPKLLATARPKFDDARIHPIARFRFTARDGMPIPTLLTIPRAHLDKPENLPAIILPHGGPEAYDRIGFDWFAQALADQG